MGEASPPRQLALNLNDGVNTITFTVELGGGASASCSAFVYLWRHDDQIVVSDIDGTITRSDTLGHVLPALGRDWTHSGIAHLYSNIARNGYNILYVTSRAIGQVRG